MAEFKQELDPEVGVEVVTLLAYEDGRPSEMVFAGTHDEHVRHVRLNETGETVMKAAVLKVFVGGIEEELVDSSAD